MQVRPNKTESSHPDSRVVDSDLISNTLEEILDSAPFRSSRQCQDLFRYIVVHSMAHDDRSLKERIIGCEVFGRPLDYNTSDDPVVRIRIGDVRKRLALFYQTLPHTAQVKINVPSGSYRAVFQPLDTLEEQEFERSSALTEADASHLYDEAQKSDKDNMPLLTVLPSMREPRIDAEPSKSARLLPPKRSLLSRLLFLIGLLVVIALLMAVLWRHWQQTSSPFNAFWSPITSAPKTPIIYVPTNAVYFLNEEKTSPPPADSWNLLPQVLPGKKIEVNDFLPNETGYVSKGDAAALSSIVSMLTNFKKPFDIRFSNDIAVSDLHLSPAILLGGFNNVWSLQMDDKLPFVFKRPQTIQQADSPYRSWTTAHDSHGNTTVDYALVSRQISSSKGQVMLTIAGVEMLGTRAAAEFVSDPVRMNQALKQLPRRWQDKNLQLLLRCHATDELPTSTEVIAYRAW
ncbi:MAG: hypothetical protein FWD64_00510 [Acidobacteriaceae bacterium]|nr:hypothetical protein [Acidobacteriaceae bacterium]